MEKNPLEIMEIKNIAIVIGNVVNNTVTMMYG